MRGKVRFLAWNEERVVLGDQIPAGPGVDYNINCGLQCARTIL